MTIQEATQAYEEALAQFAVARRANDDAAYEHRKTTKAYNGAEQAVKDAEAKLIMAARGARGATVQDIPSNCYASTFAPFAPNITEALIAGGSAQLKSKCF